MPNLPPTSPDDPTAKSQAQLAEELEEGLEESLPASDPPSAVRRDEEKAD